MSALTILTLAACTPDAPGPLGRSASAKGDPVEQYEVTPTGAREDLWGMPYPVGDVDGDGYDDLVGAGDDDLDVEGPRVLFTFFGSASGVDLSRQQIVTPPSGSDFYRTPTDAGDVDGDGFADVVVVTTDRSVLVFYGSASGLDATREQVIALDHTNSGYAAGLTVAGAGDVDGDGYDDIVVGAMAETVDGYSATGAAYVCYGSASGVDVSREQRLLASDGVGGNYFGWNLDGAGDVDADGYDDIVIGAPHSDAAWYLGGEAYLFYGSASGIDASRQQPLLIEAAGESAFLGTSVSGAGDVNADGYADVVVGAYRSSANVREGGAAYVLYGSATGIDESITQEVFARGTAAQRDQFANSVAGAGDNDSDGYDDLIIGASNDTVQRVQTGSAFWYPGSASGVDTARAVRLTPSDGADRDGFGGRVAGSADLRGVGVPELIIGASGHVHNGYDGTAYVFADATPSSCDDEDGDGVCVDRDCDDGDPTVFPGAEEGIADGVDQDCDGAELCFVDADDDGWADGEATLLSEDTDCDDLGEATLADPDGDCDDGDPDAHPGAEERCDDVDNDCDGETDEDAVDRQTWYADADGDGFGDPEAAQLACEAPEGTVADATDCDDAAPDTWPGAVEIPGDGVDQDCDGADTPAEVPDEPEDTGEDPEPEDKGCATTPAPRAGWLWLLALALGWRRRRGAAQSPASAIRRPPNRSSRVLARRSTIWPAPSTPASPSCLRAR
ncbi:MAG: FG-GAP repeat protein [Alphaproteobacteria bacterium]|nr:FG-GAP repeat protein [Alphaproteobacteria bacterium]